MLELTSVEAFLALPFKNSKIYYTLFHLQQLYKPHQAEHSKTSSKSYGSWTFAIWKLFVFENHPRFYLKILSHILKNVSKTMRVCDSEIEWL